MPLFPSLLDRVVVLAFGTVIQVDTPAGLFDRLKNQLVAAFVGKTNFVFATAHGANGGRSVEIAGLGRQKPNGIVVPHSDDEEVLIAIRPESLTLRSFPPGQDHPAVARRVRARRNVCGRQSVHIAVEGRHVCLKWVLDAMSVLDPD